MIWRGCLCVFIAAMGLKTFNMVAAEYKLRPDESPAPELAGVIFGTVVLIFLVLAIRKRKRPE
jgi:hypothetical protein